MFYKHQDDRHSAGIRCRLFILFLLLTLTIHLGSRYHHVSGSGGDKLHARVSSPKWQQLASDALQWRAPVLALTTLSPVSFYPHVSPAGPPAAALLLDESLYNRPPPAC